MLINLRNALMGDKRLPYNAEVEYLESTGAQWIDTGYSFNSATDSVELTFELLSTTPRYKWIFGAYDTKRLAIGSGDATNMRRLAYNETATYENDSFYFRGPHVFFANSTGVGIDGQKMIDFASFSTSSNILLYTIPLNAAAYCSNSRIWSYKHYRNGVLVRDYIPVRKGTVGYLYDRVSGKLFGNAGSGDFVLGPDVVPVEYIESHGTEWIDTDKSLDLPIHLEADINFTNPNTGSNVQTFVGGYKNGEANQRFWVTSLPQGRINCALLQNSISANLVPANRKVHLVVDFENGRQAATIDGVQYISASQSTTNYWFRNWKLRIFQSFGTIIASNNIPLQAITNRINIDIGASQALRLLPIRVGSGTTWAGAMMDVLTRRIYRNAGTGAFTYGNDLKYPIPSE